MEGVMEIQKEKIGEGEEFLRYTPGIKVIGIGGAGTNIVDFIFRQGIHGAEVIALNTDAAHLKVVNAHKKIIIGKELTKGLGAGGDPEKGKLAAQESLKEIKDLVSGADLVFIIAGMGGGTGTGAAPVVAKLAKEAGALVLAFAVMPMKHEGTRVLKAIQGLNALREYAHTVIVLDNEKLVSSAGDLPIYEAFNVANELVASMIKGLVETISVTSMVNLDFADLKTIMESGDVAVIGIGESDSENRAIEAVKRAMEHQLLEVDIKDAAGALVHVTGGPDMKLSEVNQICSYVKRFLNPDAQLIWGARIDNDFEKKIRVVVIITGVKSPYVLGPLKPKKKTVKSESDLGIEFI